jgi:hypothetical protein
MIHSRSIMTAAFVVLAASPAAAERVLSSLPLAESFAAAADYGDIVWLTNGCTHTWSSDGFSGGAAKFTPPTTGEGACGLGQLILSQLPAIPEQINVRFLIFHGSSWLERGPGNKLVIMNRDGNGGRPMIITRKFPDVDYEYETLGACDGTVCRYDEGDFWPQGGDRLRIGTPPSAREEEWISVELEANTTTGYIRLYVDTLDDTLNGLYIERYMDDTGPGGTWSFIDLVGGYMESVADIDADTYYMIDELAIDSRYIGPPAAFGEANPPPGVDADPGPGPGGGDSGGCSAGGSFAGLIVALAAAPLRRRRRAR